MSLRIMTGFNKSSQKAYELSGDVASEAVRSIRTVAMLRQESAFLARYKQALAAPNKASIRNAHAGGLAFGFGEAMLFLIWYVRKVANAQLRMLRPPLYIVGVRSHLIGDKRCRCHTCKHTHTHARTHTGHWRSTMAQNSSAGALPRSPT